MKNLSYSEISNSILFKQQGQHNDQETYPIRINSWYRTISF